MELTRVEPLTVLYSNSWLSALPEILDQSGVTGIGKHSSLLQCGNNYCRKSFIVHAPGVTKFSNFKVMIWVTHLSAS
jgi:hypothetical protein